MSSLCTRSLHMGQIRGIIVFNDGLILRNCKGVLYLRACEALSSWKRIPISVAKDSIRRPPKAPRRPDNLLLVETKHRGNNTRGFIETGCIY
jgi:hypothetical protein